MTNQHTRPLRPLTAKMIKGFCIRSRVILRRLLNGAATRTELDYIVESPSTPTYIHLMRDKGVVIHTTLYFYRDSRGMEGWRGKYFLGWESRGIVAAALGGAS